MSDTILYQYGSNFNALDGIGQALNDATALQEDVAKVVQAMDDVYTGAAATAFQHTYQQKISQPLDQLILDMQATKQQAVEQQIQTAALDNQMAQNIQG